MPPADGPLPHERRRRGRVQVRIAIRITYEGQQGEVCEDGICTDLSDGGIAFETDANLYVGEIVRLELRHHEADLFRFPVRLLYKMGNRYGAYFVPPGS